MIKDDQRWVDLAFEPGCGDVRVPVATHTADDAQGDDILVLTHGHHLGALRSGPMLQAP